MICPYCGKNLKQETSICPQCKRNINEFSKQAYLFANDPQLIKLNALYAKASLARLILCTIAAISLILLYYAYENNWLLSIKIIFGAIAILSAVGLIIAFVLRANTKKKIHAILPEKMKQQNNKDK